MYTHDLEFSNLKRIHPVCYSQFSAVFIHNYTVRLIHPNLTCAVLFFLGHGDHFYQEKSIDLPFNITISLLSDHFIVRCNQSKKELHTENRTSQLEMPYISIRDDHTVRKRLAAVTKQKEDLNVLILALDSVSRLQYKRMLPKTYAYLTNKLHGIVLKG